MSEITKKETTLSAESVSLTIQMQTVSWKTHLKRTYSFVTLTVEEGPLDETQEENLCSLESLRRCTSAFLKVP